MPEPIPPTSQDSAALNTDGSPALIRTSADGSVTKSPHQNAYRSAMQQSDSRRHEKIRKPGFGIALFGVILPLFTLYFESSSRLCATEWFNPIPTWFHTLLVALVPASNLLVLITRLSSATRYRGWLAHLNAVAIGVSVAYALAFLPYVPFSIFGVIFFGMGLMPLSPIFAVFATLSARRCLPHWNRIVGEAPAPLPRAFPLAFAAIAALAFPIAHSAITQYAIDLAASDNTSTQRRAVTFLRILGSKREMLEACYPSNQFGGFFMPRTSRSEAAVEKARGTYYRVTGNAFNTQAAPAAFNTRGMRGITGWNVDNALGGERVANKVGGLSMEASRLDGKIDSAALSCYTEWTVIFKNAAADPAEARAQIALPPGGVVSRLTLWINGEPCEAAFGGRSQVRAAYQEVAVVQQRDPVLVTTCGPDRVLMQCFPVPANGGEMKVRLGITAPLHLTSERTAAMDWPRLIETNFENSESLRHSAWIECTTPLESGAKTFRQEIKDTQLAEAAPVLVPLPDTARDVVSEDPSNESFVIRQQIQSLPVEKPSRIVIVVDGSREMAQYSRALEEIIPSVPGNVSVYFAGDETQRWAGGEALGKWISRHSFRGGCDNLPALALAWDEANSAPGGALLWLHGPQPVLLSRIEGLLQQVERSRTKPALYTLSVGAGPNRILEQLDGITHWETVPHGGSFELRLRQFISRLTISTRWVVSRDRIPRAEASAGLPVADRHVTRLWGREEIERLRGSHAKLDEAVKLALQLQLVTPVSGAVVLERKEQYDRHGLKPADAATVPTVVPEPATAALALAASALWFGFHRRGRTRQ